MMAAIALSKPRNPGLDEAQRPKVNALIYTIRSQQSWYVFGFPLATMAIRLCLSALGIYFTFQIQTISYLVRREPSQPAGTEYSPEATACLAPFAGSGKANLTSYILYLNESYMRSAVS
jgi:hypothetical protein